MSDEYERFIATVQLTAGVARPDAERAARAVLETLGERLSAGEARHLAEWLPPDRRGAWTRSSTRADRRDLFDAFRRTARGETSLPEISEPLLAAAGHALGADDLPLLGMLIHRTAAPDGPGHTSRP